jgi:hypothetical protein
MKGADVMNSAEVKWSKIRRQPGFYLTYYGDQLKHGKKLQNSIRSGSAHLRRFVREMLQPGSELGDSKRD